MRDRGAPTREDADESKSAAAATAADDGLYEGDEYSDGYSSDPNYYEPDPEPAQPVEYRPSTVTPRYRHSANLSASHIAPLSVSDSTTSRRPSLQRDSVRNDIDRESPQRWLDRNPQYAANATPATNQPVQQRTPQDPQQELESEQQSHSTSNQPYTRIPPTIHYGTPQNTQMQPPQMHYPHKSYSRSRTPVMPPDQPAYDPEQWKYRYSERPGQYPVMSSWYWQPNEYYDSPNFEMSGPSGGAGGHNRGLAPSSRPLKPLRVPIDGSGEDFRVVDPETESMVNRSNNNVPLLRERALTSNKENVKYRLMTPENIQKFPSLVKNINCPPNGPGQTRSNSGGSLPKVSTAIWETEGTICLVVELQRTSVTRRYDNNMINGTKLLNASGITRGRRDGVLKGEKVRHVVKIGGMDFKGVWIPYERALSIAQAEGVLEKLYPLFVADLCPILQSPQNYSRIRQMLARSVKRNPKFQPKANRMLASIFSDESPNMPLEVSGSAQANQMPSASPGHIQQPRQPRPPQQHQSQHQQQQRQQHQPQQPPPPQRDHQLQHQAQHQVQHQSQYQPQYQSQSQSQSQPQSQQRQSSDSQAQRQINEDGVVRNYMPLDQRYDVRALGASSAAKMPNPSTGSGNSDSEYYTSPHSRNPDSQ